MTKFVSGGAENLPRLLIKNRSFSLALEGGRGEGNGERIFYLGQCRAYSLASADIKCYRDNECDCD